MKGTRTSSGAADDDSDSALTARAEGALVRLDLGCQASAESYATNYTRYVCYFEKQGYLVPEKVTELNWPQISQ